MAGEALAAALRERSRGGLPAVVPYITAGFPRRDDTVAVLAALQDAGCAAAEIGIPFSDPLADGPTIQRSGTRALANGMTATLAIEQAAAARAAGVSVPLVLMTYVNVVLSRGAERFCGDAAAAGVDGLIVPDLPAGEAADVRAAAAGVSLALVPLLAPTSTTARIADACQAAQGFVYCVGVTGTTGARADVTADAYRLLDDVGRHTTLPRALGFGLSRHEHLVSLAGRCEAAVVGSALIDAMAAVDEGPRAASRFVRAMLSRA